MKKFFLTSLSMLFALASFAQTSIETATPMTGGENKFTNEQSTDRFGAYWKYTSKADEIVVASAINGSNLSGYEYVEGQDEPANLPTGSYNQIVDGTTVFNNVFPVPAGKTIYISAFGSGTVGFNATVVKSPYVGHGTSEDDWATIIPGAQQFFGNNNNSRYNPVCFKFTPERDGVLVVKASDGSYVQDEAGVQYPLERNYDTYTNDAKVTVVGGKENKLKLYAYGAVYITSEMTYPEPGSFDRPFAVAEGANVVPKAAGTYWYVVAGKYGLATIASGDAYTGGKLSVYSSTQNVKDNKPDTESKTGQYNVFFPAANNSTYYIKVEKGETDADQTFNYSVADFKEGDTEDLAINITDFTKEYTVPAGKTVYYSIKMTEVVKKNLVVASTSDLANDGTSVTLYQGSYDAVTGHQTATKIVAGTSWSTPTYYIKWVSKEDADFNFTAVLEDLAKGDDVTNPLDAQLGENVMTGDGTKYYAYASTQAGKLSVTVPEGVKVQFNNLSGYGYMDAVQSGNTFSIDAAKDVTYTMEMTGCTKDAVFTVAYGEWAVGEAASNPMIVENGEFTLSGEAATVWAKYTVKDDCKLVIDATDMAYKWNNGVDYCPDGQLDQLKSLYLYEGGQDMYKATLEAAKGESYLVKVKVKNAYDEPFTVKFIEEQPAPGETVKTAIVLNAGETVEIATANYYSPVWVKIPVKAGETTLVSSDAAASGQIYFGLDEATNGYGAEVNFKEVTTGEGDDQVTRNEYVINAPEDCDAYFKVAYTTGCTLSLPDVETGINGAAAAGAQAVEFYSLDGVKLSAPQKGVNIVKMSDGRTVKMVVRK